MTPAARRAVTPVRVHAVEGRRVSERPDRIVTEEPMEIRVQNPGETPAPLVVTMRTPGHDFELAVGFCRTEGVLLGAGDLAEVRYCLGGDGEQEYNVVTVALRVPAALEVQRRPFVAHASCGLCGKATLDQVEIACPPVGPGPRVVSSTLLALPERLRAAQKVFDETGGLHAAALFSPAGELRVLREDIGRHNAVDKIVGHALMHDDLPLADGLLFVSGRLSFEIVQKAAIAGVSVLGAVSAPSSLAVAAAGRLGLTLVGFLREDRANIYTHPERVLVEA